MLEQIEEKTCIKPRYVVIRPVYNELLKIASKSNGILKRKALFALQLVERFFEILDFEQHVNESVDDAIIRFAMENKAIVATNDRELRSKLRQYGITE
ncbi:MAG: 30S processome protein Utp24, partial [Desulfurococcaceae archaeon]